MRIVLKNNFHNTEVSLNAYDKHGKLRLSATQVLKAKKKLCPSKDCTCSNFLGLRGPQDYIFTPNPDGTADGHLITVFNSWVKNN